MLCSPTLLIIFSFLTIPIDSAQSFAAENLNFLTVVDPAVTIDISLGDVSTFSAESPAPLSNSDSIFASESLLAEESLFADNLGGTDEPCQAESISLSSIVGKRLKLREEFDLISEGGKTCAAPPEKSNEEDLDSLLQHLPEGFLTPDPGVGENRDICPEKTFGKHKIPVCSSGDPRDEYPILGSGSMSSLYRATNAL